MSDVFRGKLPVIGAIVGGTAAVLLYGYYRVYSYVHKYRKVFKEMGLQELPAKTWIGSWDLYMNSPDLFELELRLIKEHGKVFGYFEGRQPTITVADLDMLKQVMLKDHENFVDRKMLFPARSRPVDLGLITLTGPRWKHVRQVITPAFTPANLRRMEPLVKKVADQFVTNVGKQADSNGVIDVKMYAGCYSMDIIGSVAFAMELDSLNNPDNPFVSGARTAFATITISGSFIASAFMFPDFAAWLLRAFPKNETWINIMTFFEKVVSDEIDRRRAHEGDVTRTDFLAVVMPSEKDPKDPANKDALAVDEYGGMWLRNGITKDEIIGQAVLFFMAGYETTANTITMTLLALSQYPDVQERLYKEVKEAFGNGKEMTMESLSELKYFEMVINETLRFYTPFLRINRVCTSDTVLNGLHVPKGVTINIPVNAIHHDPDYWPEPDVFNPERFSDENKGSIPPMAFLPFGVGNRNCIGMRLAQLEMKMLLASLVLNFKFKLSPKTEQPIRWLNIDLRTARSPIYLEAERR